MYSALRRGNRKTVDFPTAEGMSNKTTVKQLLDRAPLESVKTPEPRVRLIAGDSADRARLQFQNRKNVK